MDFAHRSSCDVMLDLAPAPQIKRIELELKAAVPNIDPGKFRGLAADAERGCPVSKALSPVPMERDADYGVRYRGAGSKASIQAKVEHPFPVIKRFGYTQARYRGLVKNTAQVLTLFALSNLWMARKQLLLQ
jgi:hypothetical protein